MTAQVAALYVDARGPYPKLLGAEQCWGETRDARAYPGPWPVVAHPPCARWCRLAKFVEHRTGGRLALGDDGRCFEAALRAIHTWGGIIEHPAWTHAWAANGLPVPPAVGWQQVITGEWLCEVAQSAYGHRARKATWLVYVGRNAPAPARWDKPIGTHYVGSCTRRAGGQRWKGTNYHKRELSRAGRNRTPLAFAEYLIGLAAECGGPHA